MSLNVPHQRKYPKDLQNLTCIMSSTRVPHVLFVDSVTKQLSKLLTNEEHHAEVFRLHDKQLSLYGDLSFQTNLKFAAWKHLRIDATSNKWVNIFEYASNIHNKTINADTIPQIINESTECTVRIAKCCMIKTNCHVFLDREYATRTILSEILTNHNYGEYRIVPGIRISYERTSEDKNQGLECVESDLSHLRMKILHDIIKNFVTTDETVEKPCENTREIYLTTKSSDTHPQKILCGCVLNSKGQKEESLTSADLYDEFKSNMRMMFEHKFGVRNIADSPNWRQKIDKLGHAAVTFLMIQNTPQKAISLASTHHVIRDAAFVIYNGARIASILRRFQAEFVEAQRRVLPIVASVDFSELRLDEEWELVYVFLGQYPAAIRHCVRDLMAGKLYFQKLYDFLTTFSRAFSVYYSRIKIITEAKEHLLPALYARVYLLRAIERVLSNALRLVNIELVNQM